MAKLWKTKITSEPSHEDDIAVAWVRINGDDIGQPEKGKRTLKLSPGTYPIHLYARGRPGAKWTITVESKGLTYPDPKKTTFELKMRSDSKDDRIQFRLKLKKAAKKVAKKTAKKAAKKTAKKKTGGSS